MSDYEEEDPVDEGFDDGGDDDNDDDGSAEVELGSQDTDEGEDEEEEDASVSMLHSEVLLRTSKQLTTMYLAVMFGSLIRVKFMGGFVFLHVH